LGLTLFDWRACLAALAWAVGSYSFVNLGRR
jgi:hypothetical protein